MALTWDIVTKLYPANFATKPLSFPDKQYQRATMIAAATKRGVVSLLLVLSCLLVSLGHVQASTASLEASPRGEISVAMEDLSRTFDNSQDIRSVTLEGVELPAQQELNGKTLYRNGHGLRSFTFYGLSMKMYVASFYSEIPFRSAEDVLSCSGCPMLFHFTFLRSVRQGQVKLAWQKQLDWSVSYTYDGYDKDKAAFVNMFGAMEDHGTVTVKFVGDETLVYDQGTLKGTIKGENFQRAFLTMWFGEQAVADDLKVALLGNSSVNTALA